MNQYYYALNGQQVGPVTMEQLIALCQSGQITPATLVWMQGMAQWQPLSTIMPQAPAPAPMPAPMPGAMPAAMPTPMPGVMPGAPAGMVKPDNGMVMAVLVTLFCCLIGGVIAIINASKVDGLWAAGQYQQAIEAAQTSKKWSIASIIIGAVSTVGYVLLMAAGA